MKNLNFKYAGAWNFLPFGPDGIEIRFKDYGNIVFVEGINKDAKNLETEENIELRSVSSNGTGKSSIQEIIVFTIYGKTIKRPEKINVDDVVHNKIGKDCKCTVEFDKYKIVRTRMENGKKNKNSLRLWESEDGVWDDSTEITLGSMASTQKKIDEIVGLSYESFINICIFTDDQRSCFLECDKATKREIVENLLSLGSYRDWFENAKSIKKEIKSNIDGESKEFSMLLNNKEDAEKRFNLTKSKKDQWLVQKKQEEQDLRKKIEEKKTELKGSNNGEAIALYQEAQEKIQKINEIIPTIESQKKEFQDKIILIEQKEIEQKENAQIFSENFNDFSRELKYKIEEKNKKQKEIEALKSEEPGKVCNKCKGVVEVKNINNYIAELEKEILEASSSIKEKYETLKKMEEESNLLKEKQEKLKKMKTQMEKKILEFNNEGEKLRRNFLELSKVKEPKANANELSIKEKIDELTEQLNKKEAEKESPFEDILQNNEKELNKINKLLEEKKKMIDSLENKLPYYDYWISGFGEQGIRKWIIDGIIPDLNKRINYWLHFLIDNMITLSFDNELQEKIERNPPDGDPYIYYAMSTGQRRRLNLAVGHSFAYITELSSDSIPSLIFLDEVTTNVDPNGVVGIYKMIQELAENKQVFVTTHDQDLIKLLEGESKLKLVHENGFTKKV